MYKNIIFTFDYELFLGKKSGSVENCLIKPTNLLLDLLKKNEIKNLIFFVDTTYLLRLQAEQNPNTRRDFEIIGEQLKQINQDGHYIFPHIHPHWLDAKYITETNQWDLGDISKYRFNSISNEDKEKVFEDSIGILKLILGNEIILDSYRAGGWCLQPFEDFLPFFKKFNIKNDFSVLPGEVTHNRIQYYDFTNSPKKNVYSFQDDVCMENIHGNFVEYSISNFKPTKVNNFLNKFLLKFLWKIGTKNFGDGNGAISTNTHFQKPVNEMISIELLTSARLPLYMKFANRFDYMQFISHPKMISKHNLKYLDLFLKKLKKKHIIQTDFRKINVV